MRLDRAGDLQEVGVGVGQHVGRHGQRQHQRPVQQPLAGEAVHGDQPAGAGADRQRARADAQAEQRAVAQILGQHGAGQMRPQPLGRLADEAQQRQQRRCHDQAEQAPRAACRDPGSVQTTPAERPPATARPATAVDMLWQSRSDRCCGRRDSLFVLAAPSAEATGGLGSSKGEFGRGWNGYRSRGGAPASAFAASVAGMHEGLAAPSRPGGCKCRATAYGSVGQGDATTSRHGRRACRAGRPARARPGAMGEAGRRDPAPAAGQADPDARRAAPRRRGAGPRRL